MRSITIRLSAQDEERLDAICKRDGLPKSEVMRALLRKDDEQKAVIVELQKLQNAICGIGQRPEGGVSTDQSAVLLELQKLQIAINEIGKNGSGDEFSAAISEMKKVQSAFYAGIERFKKGGAGEAASADIESALMQLIDIAARQYLLSVQAVSQQIGKNYAISADTKAKVGADEFFKTAKVDFEIM